MGQFIAHPWAQPPLTQMVYLLSFLSYLADSESVSACQSDPDTITFNHSKSYRFVERQKLRRKYECVVKYAARALIVRTRAQHLDAQKSCDTDTARGLKWPPKSPLPVLSCRPTYRLQESGRSCLARWPLARLKRIQHRQPADRSYQVTSYDESSDQRSVTK